MSCGNAIYRRSVIWKSKFWASANRCMEEWTWASRKHKLFVGILLDIIDVNKLNLCSYFIISMWRFVGVSCSMKYVSTHKLKLKGATSPGKKTKTKKNHPNKKYTKLLTANYIYSFIANRDASGWGGLVVDSSVFFANNFHENKYIFRPTTKVKIVLRIVWLVNRAVSM